MARRSGWLLISFCLVALLAGNVYAAPSVAFKVSGSSGNWTLDFSVTNTLGANNNIYFFGGLLPAPDITATPSGWHAYPGSYKTFINIGPNQQFRLSFCMSLGEMIMATDFINFLYPIAIS